MGFLSLEGEDELLVIHMKTLIVEDDPEVACYVEKGLRESGWVVDLAENGKEGLYLALNETYDAIILDRMLPHVDGLDILKTIRSCGKTTPVLLLSALGEVGQRVEGLNAGGDDYLAKPFSFSELHARLMALSRRNAWSLEGVETRVHVGDLEIDFVRREVSRGGERIELKAKEYSLLEYMARHKGQIVTRTMLLENVWDYHFDPQTNVIDVHVSRLRSKIDRGRKTPLLKTVRGMGYRLG